MPDDLGARIAARAISHVGAPFRLHGRSMDGGFDCIGLAADALLHVGSAVVIPSDYSLRGQFESQLFAFFGQATFQMVSSAKPGDFLAVRTAPRQLHLMITTESGAVHAHAGLLRVVLTPLPPPWPVIGQWRFIGE